VFQSLQAESGEGLIAGAVAKCEQDRHRRAGPRLLDAEPAVTKGEVGELFYVVVEGELAVCLNGQQRRRLGPGDAFGEIALLKAVPRTASVLSVGSSRLLSIDGQSFVAAVTGHRLAEQLAYDAAYDLLQGDKRSSA